MSFCSRRRRWGRAVRAAPPRLAVGTVRTVTTVLLITDCQPADCPPALRPFLFVLGNEELRVSRHAASPTHRGKLQSRRLRDQYAIIERCRV